MNVVKASNETDWADWVWQITLGNADAEDELFRRYKDGIAVKRLLEYRWRRSRRATCANLRDFRVSSAAWREMLPLATSARRGD